MQIFKKIFLIYLVLFIWLRQVLVMACELNLNLTHWEHSLKPLDHQGSPTNVDLKARSSCLKIKLDINNPYCI